MSNFGTTKSAFPDSRLNKINSLRPVQVAQLSKIRKNGWVVISVKNDWNTIFPESLK